MAGFSQQPKSRNRAIARDLENLPLELIERVIKEATFERVIRLSSWAGLRLMQALTISPSWRHLMGTEEHRKTWQTCLRLTDDLNVLCFDTRHVARPFFNDQTPINCWHTYRYTDRTRCHCSKGVSFLQGGPLYQDCDAPTMRQRWLDVLSTRFSIKISFKDIPLFDALDDYSEEERTLFEQLVSLGRRSMSADELESGIRLYQRALAARQTALSNELRRLAALYETHPSLLKVPFAPQTTRPRAAHVPEQFGARARRLESSPLTLHSQAFCRTYFQNVFLALVPYDWTLRFFVAVWSKQQVLSDKSQFVLDGLACYFLRKVEDSSNCENVRTISTPWSLSHHKAEQPKFLAGKCAPIRGRGGPYATHTDIELTWLEAFVELVADLVEKFPQAAEAAQAEGRLQEAEPNMLAEQLVAKMQLL